MPDVSAESQRDLGCQGQELEPGEDPSWSLQDRKGYCPACVTQTEASWFLGFFEAQI